MLNVALLTLTVLIIASTVCYLIERAKPNPIWKEKRKGIYKMTVEHLYHYQEGYAVTLILEEQNRIASQSEVKILHYHGLPRASRNVIKQVINDKVGQYIKTDLVEWHETAEEIDQEALRALEENLKLEKIIKTPLNELLRSIEEEDIGSL